MHQKVKLLGIRLDLGDRQQLTKYLSHKIKTTNRGLQITTPNPEHLIQAQDNPEFFKVLNNADVSIIDGIGIVYALKFLKFFGRKHFSVSVKRITGVEFITDILKFCRENHWHVGLLGSTFEVRKKTISRLNSQYPDLSFFNIGGHKNIKKYSQIENQQLINNINHHEIDFLLVAYGAPEQELWIAKHLQKLNSVKLAMGVGGSFDFISGKLLRAPKLFQILGLEWLFRLLQQPSRFKRQLRLLRFVYLVFKKELFLS